LIFLFAVVLRAREAAKKGYEDRLILWLFNLLGDKGRQSAGGRLHGSFVQAVAHFG